MPTVTWTQFTKDIDFRSKFIAEGKSIIVEEKKNTKHRKKARFKVTPIIDTADNISAQSLRGILSDDADAQIDILEAWEPIIQKYL